MQKNNSKDLKRYAYLILFNLMLLVITAGCSVAGNISEGTKNQSIDKIKIGVSDGAPFVLTKQFSELFGDENVDIENIEIYTFQDC